MPPPSRRSPPRPGHSAHQPGTWPRARRPPPRRRPPQKSDRREAGRCSPVRYFLKTTAMAAVTFNMSTAPLPHTKPSDISAANGSTDQPDRFTGTTSRCGKQQQRRRLGVFSGNPVDDRLPARGQARPPRPVGRKTPRGFPPIGIRAPLSRVPSLTHRFRISSWRSGTTAVLSPIMGILSSVWLVAVGECRAVRTSWA